MLFKKKKVTCFELATFGTLNNIEDAILAQILDLS